MEDQNHAYTSAIVENIDPYSMLMDVLKNLWVVLLGALAVAMIVNMISRANYESTYTTNTTFVVSSQNANSSTYSNLNAAQSMANSFTNILNSDILKKKVCDGEVLPGAVLWHLLWQNVDDPVRRLKQLFDRLSHRKHPLNPAAAHRAPSRRSP